MCSRVFCNDGSVAETVAELRAMMGVTLALDRCYSMPDTDLAPNDCLCPVDIETTAFAAGFRCQKRDDGDYDVSEILPV